MLDRSIGVLLIVSPLLVVGSLAYGMRDFGILGGLVFALWALASAVGGVRLAMSE